MSRKQSQVVAPGVLLVSDTVTELAEWPPPGNVLDDEAKNFVRVQLLHVGPFDISKQVLAYLKTKADCPSKLQPLL